MQMIPRVIAGLMGALLALPFALGWLLAPEAAAGDLGISLDGAAALSHMRGDTGGAFFAIGALVGIGIFRKEAGYLEAVAFIMSCIVLARMLGVALDGFDPAVGTSMAFEVVTALAAFATARQLRAEPSR